MFTWTSCWANSRYACNWRRHDAHVVMTLWRSAFSSQLVIIRAPWHSYKSAPMDCNKFIRTKFNRAHQISLQLSGTETKYHIEEIFVAVCVTRISWKWQHCRFSEAYYRLMSSFKTCMIAIFHVLLIIIPSQQLECRVVVWHFIQQRRRSCFNTSHRGHGI